MYKSTYFLIGSNQFVSDVTHYLQNHRSWLSVIGEYKNHINFQGIVITGWQRYDHFAILCELLPVGIPTLAMSLRLLLGEYKLIFGIRDFVKYVLTFK